MRRILSVVLPALFFLLLLFFPKPSIQGAGDGLLLWFHRVLPVLLPFALASRLLVETHLPERLPPRLCVMLMGFACGYPMGAIWSAALVENGQLSEEEGERLLLFCSQPSPMFLSGYLGIQVLQINRIWPLLVSAYLPPLLLGLLLLRRIPSAGIRSGGCFSPLTISGFEKAWMESCRILLKIGGYLMFFSILASVCGYLLREGTNWKPLLIGFFEMTTGISLLAETALPLPLRNAIGLFLACFGGLSTLAQTMSCLADSPLRGRYYFGVKFFCALLSATFYYILWGMP